VQNVFTNDWSIHLTGEETMIGDQSFQYLTMDDMKVLKDDSVHPTKVTVTLFYCRIFGRCNTVLIIYAVFFIGCYEIFINNFMPMLPIL